jgi:hypothetical protein
MNRSQTLFVMLGMAGLLAAPARAATHAWKGYISDSHCNAAGAKPGHVACARACVRKGYAPVFVADGSHAVLAIANPRRVLPDLGRHVWISGTVNAATHTLRVQRMRRLP